MKLRLDKLVVERALAPSRERAQALILAGRVLVNEQKETKPGHSVDAESALRLLGEDQRYVSRGGFKLEGALRHWEISLTGRGCVDIGASTGGFTDCMLQHGASRVLAVDTGYGQLAASLRTDPRVLLLERTNARHLAAGELERLGGELSFLSMDVSFISATLVLPAVLQAAPTLREAVVLVKPQFEAGREWVEKGGIVRDSRAHAVAIERVREAAVQAGAEAPEWIESPITGAEGNREFLLHFRLSGR